MVPYRKMRARRTKKRNRKMCVRADFDIKNKNIQLIVISNTPIPTPQYINRGLAKMLLMYGAIDTFLFFTPAARRTKNYEKCPTD